MLTLAAAIFAAFTVAPAAAGTDSHGTPAVWCDEPSAFDSLDRFAVPSTARGAVVREKQLGQVHKNVPTNRSRANRPGFSTTVPTSTSSATAPSATCPTARFATRFVSST